MNTHTPISCGRTPAGRSASGFSLVELIVVIGVISIITALVAPAVSSLGRSSALVTGGNMVTNMATLARQEAMSKNTMTALLVLTNLDPVKGSENDYRALAVAQYEDANNQTATSSSTTQSGNWKLITKWEILPTGVVLDDTIKDEDHSSTFFLNSPSPFPFSPQFFYQSNKLDQPEQFAARIFLPNGSLRNADQPAQLRVVEGFRDGRVTRYTHPGGTGSPANYYDVAIIGATGTTKISRP